MNVPVELVVFAVTATASLGASGILVIRLERIAKRLDLSEPALGLLAALAADAPEISSALAALIHHDRGIGAGIIVGSNLFNIATLLGLAAVVAAPLALERSLTVVEGVPALLLAIVSACLVARWVPPVIAMLAVLLIVVAYGALAILGPSRLSSRNPLAKAVASALEAEASDLEQIVHVAPATGLDFGIALLSVVGVVAASALMENAAVRLGVRFQLSALVVGGLVLAAVTSIPNVVAALYLSKRRRVAALVSEASNSNTLNVLFGLALPAVFFSGGGSSGLMSGIFYVALTIFAYGGIWIARGFRRSIGIGLLAGYAAFVASAVLR